MVSKLRIVLKRTRSTKEKAELEVEREQAAGARAALEQLLTRSRRATARAERKVQELLWRSLGTLQLSAESAGHDAGRMHVAASVSDEEEQDGGGGGRETTPLSPAALAGCVLKVAIVADDNELATAATAAESAKRALF